MGSRHEPLHGQYGETTEACLHRALCGFEKRDPCPGRDPDQARAKERMYPVSLIFFTALLELM